MEKPKKRLDLDPLSDAELIEKILFLGDSHLFGELYNRYVDRVKRRCQSLVHNPAVVDDLVQDIFMKVLQNLNRFRSASSFSTWLYSITYNHCIEYLRKEKRIKFDAWANQLDIPDEVHDVEVEEILSLKKERVILLLEMLKPEDKAILLMKYHEGLRLKGIMEILKIQGESAAKMKISRAKKRLVGLYQELFGD